LFSPGEKIAKNEVRLKKKKKGGGGREPARRGARLVSEQLSLSKKKRLVGEGEAKKWGGPSKE